MIHLEIIKSNDPLALGLYEYEFDQITIGRSKKNDLIFIDRDMPLHFLTIKLIQKQLAVQSQNKTTYFVNGKKVSGILKLKPEDILSFGDHQIRIIKSMTSHQDIDFSESYEAFNAKAPELKFALDFIEQVLVNLEGDSNV